MDIKAVHLTTKHPFYENMKSYPKCFQMLGGNNNIEWIPPKAIFCSLKYRTDKPTTNRDDGPLASIIFVENGANIYNHGTDKSILESSDWEIIKPYIENSEYICYTGPKN